MFYTWMFLINVGTHSVREQKWCIAIHHTVRLTEFSTHFHIFQIVSDYFNLSEGVCQKLEIDKPSIALKWLGHHLRAVPRLLTSFMGELKDFGMQGFLANFAEQCSN